MGYRKSETTFFELPDGSMIKCWSEGTRYGFRHLAELLDDHFNILAKDKACYYNRTWESYTFQTVIKGVLAKHYNEFFASEYEHGIHDKESAAIDRQFGMVGAIAKLGDILTEDETAQAKWKRRMLEAGLPGLDFPDDFEQLSPEEQNRRLDAVIGMAMGVDSHLESDYEDRTALED